MSLGQGIQVSFFIKKRRKKIVIRPILGTRLLKTRHMFAAEDLIDSKNLFNLLDNGDGEVTLEDVHFPELQWIADLVRLIVAHLHSHPRVEMIECLVFSLLSFVENMLSHWCCHAAKVNDLI